MLTALVAVTALSICAEQTSTISTSPASSMQITSINVWTSNTSAYNASTEHSANGIRSSPSSTKGTEENATMIANTTRISIDVTLSSSPYNAVGDAKVLSTLISIVTLATPSMITTASTSNASSGKFTTAQSAQSFGLNSTTMHRAINASSTIVSETSTTTLSPSGITSTAINRTDVMSATTSTESTTSTHHTTTITGMPTSTLVRTGTTSEASSSSILMSSNNSETSVLTTSRNQEKDTSHITAVWGSVLYSLTTATSPQYESSTSVYSSISSIHPTWNTTVLSGTSTTEIMTSQTATVHATASTDSLHGVNSSVLINTTQHSLIRSRENEASFTNNDTTVMVTARATMLVNESGGSTSIAKPSVPLSTDVLSYKPIMTSSSNHFSSIYRNETTNYNSSENQTKMASSVINILLSATLTTVTAATITSTKTTVASASGLFEVASNVTSQTVFSTSSPTKQLDPSFSGITGNNTSDLQTSNIMSALLSSDSSMNLIKATPSLGPSAAMTDISANKRSSMPTGSPIVYSSILYSTLTTDVIISTTGASSAFKVSNTPAAEQRNYTQLLESDSLLMSSEHVQVNSIANETASSLLSSSRNSLKMTTTSQKTAIMASSGLLFSSINVESYSPEQTRFAGTVSPSSGSTISSVLPESTLNTLPSLPSSITSTLTPYQNVTPTMSIVVKPSIPSPASDNMASLAQLTSSIINTTLFPSSRWNVNLSLESAVYLITLSNVTESTLFRAPSTSHLDNATMSWNPYTINQTLSLTKQVNNATELRKPSTVYRTLSATSHLDNTTKLLTPSTVYRTFSVNSHLDNATELRTTSTVYRTFSMMRHLDNSTELRTPSIVYRTFTASSHLDNATELMTTSTVYRTFSMTSRLENATELRTASTVYRTFSTTSHLNNATELLTTSTLYRSFSVSSHLDNAKELLDTSTVYLAPSPTSQLNNTTVFFTASTFNPTPSLTSQLNNASISLAVSIVEPSSDKQSHIKPSVTRTVSPSSSAIEPEPLRAIDVELTILNEEFDESLRNESSTAFKNMSQKVIDAVALPLSSLGYQTIQINSFSPGSVIVNFTLLTISSSNATVAEIKEAIENSNGTNPQSFQYSRVLVTERCTAGLCFHGGSCLSNNTGPFCKCRAGFTGTRCETVKVDGNYSAWSEFSQCSKSCDGGIKTRTRTCTNPSPSGGGRECPGPNTEEVNCNEDVTCSEIWIAIGVSCAVVVLLVIIILILICLRRKQKERSAYKQDYKPDNTTAVPIELMEYANPDYPGQVGSPGHVNPEFITEDETEEDDIYKAQLLLFLKQSHLIKPGMNISYGDNISDTSDYSRQSSRRHSSASGVSNEDSGQVADHVDEIPDN